MKTKFTTTVIALLILCNNAGLHATIRYVDAARPNNSGGGTSWATAYKDPQVAINAVADGDTVWVKAGTYLPTVDASGNTPGNARDKAFWLTTKNIKFLGGFAGFETSPTQRDPFTNLTILSGDLDGTAGTADSYHVLVTDSRNASCLIDGFTIQGGRANAFGTSPTLQYNGGGIYNMNSSPTLTRCIIRNNSASEGGGGIYNYSSSPAISNCVISGNTSHDGGGIHAIGSFMSLINCVITGNTCSRDGGGVQLYQGNINVYNCTFSGNKATDAASMGGGVFFNPNASSGGAFLNTILYGNTTPANGADAGREEVSATGSSGATLNYCYLRDYGGGSSGIFGSPISTGDPGFVDATNPVGPDGLWGTYDDGLRIPCGSGAKDGSDPSQFANYTATIDLVGNTRNGTADRGAYETFGSIAAGPVPAKTTAVPGNQTAAVVNYTDCSNQIATINATSPKTLAGQVTAKVYIQTTAPAFNGQKYVRRSYDISPATNRNTATATVTLYFTQADFDDYNANNGTAPDLPTGPSDNTGKANLKITQQHGVGSTGLPGSYAYSGAGNQNVVIDPVDADVVWNASASRWEVTFDVTGFSGFFAYGSNSIFPLPLKLLSFTANKENDHSNLLSWATATEDASTVFEVTRSTNGSDFKTLSSIHGKGIGATYAYDDNQPLTGINYYRLRITENGGAVSYSNVAIINSSVHGGSIIISPVPATNTITITNTDAALNGQSIVITDIQGRSICNAQLSSQAIIDVHNWPAGIYCLRLGNGYTVRLVKQ